MIKRVFLFLLIGSSIAGNVRERYEDGRPVYDNNGNLIIWTMQDIRRWHLDGANHTANYEFKESKKQ